MNIGLYGGTFSPPHIAHRRSAELFAAAASLDKLYVMPAGIPPHKTADRWGRAEYRLEMARLAFEDIAEVSDYEITKEGRSYTVDTLRWLKARHPDSHLHMLVGEDMFLSLDSWREPFEIMKLCTIVAVRRKDTPQTVMEEAARDYKERYGAQIILMEVEPLEVSSTQIREMISRDMDARSLLGERVAEYIKDHGLYRNEN